MNSDERQVDGGQAIVDVLLRERLGGEVVPDLTAVVLTRAAQGEAADAAARLAQAERAVAGVPSARGRWLAAALVLLGLGVVVAIAVSRREGRDGAVAPVQQPQQGQEPEVVPVQSKEQLQELLPQTVGMTIEFWRLPFCDFELPVRMPPFQFDTETAKAFAAYLASDVRSEPAAGWKWTNRLRLLLRDGRAIEMAFQDYDDALDRDKRVRMGVRGMQGDISVGTKGMPKARQPGALWDAALLAAQACNGLLVRRMDLGADSIAAFRGCESLKLVPTSGDRIWSLGDIRSRDLAALADLPKLRRLDVSRQKQVIDAEALQHIAKITQLEELVLDGCAIDDDALLPIGQLPHLQALSLRGCAHVRGNALLQLLEGAQPPAPPFQALERLDLSDCAQLQDFVLPNLAAMPKLKQLRMANTPLPGDDKRWQIFKLSSKVEVLDLSGHPFATDRLRDLAELSTLRELLLCNCDLDPSDLEILATSRGLRRLAIGDNAALFVSSQAETDADLLRFVRSTTLAELDLRAQADLANRPAFEFRVGYHRVICR